MSTTPEIGEQIESLIHADEWDKARKLIRSALKKDPEDHWLLCRLALTYYEQFDYGKALEVSSIALRLAPNCPLALWEQAGTLEMLGRQNEAILIYRRLVKRGAAKIAFGDCGEGLARARGLVADSLYRLATCYETLGQMPKASNYFEQHFAERGPGCHSIYPLKEVKLEYEQLLGRRNA